MIKYYLLDNLNQVHSRSPKEQIFDSRITTIFWGPQTKFIHRALKDTYLIPDIMKKATCYETQQIHELMLLRCWSRGVSGGKRAQFKNLAVAGGIVRSAKQLLRKVSTGSPLKP